ncbi:sensor domain-containing diguanylate cyclase [Heliorestis convoluta]|uniref:Diguanylate cyclase GGDEF domain protein n=1 Tax=Heliorestis convoluta TaxID=356322 RepID=A0A5Q2N988_9FIRM|nr:GGDEF domain-containing protein [Heliorestis convoluta]QGG49065.1 Diguanylate cyclase GGDEF domain protein [Heliorestis convoluta]
MCKNNRYTALEGVSQDEGLLYRELLANASDMIYKLDLQGHFTEVSPIATTLTGYGSQELLGRNLKEIVATDHHSRIDAMLMQGVVAKEPNRFEIDILTKKGHLITLDNHCTLVCRADKPCFILGIARDVTKYKALTRQLAEHQALLKSLMNSMPDIVFYKDTEGHYLGCNKDFEKLVGKTESEIVGLKDVDLFPPEIVALYQEQEHLLMKTKKTQRVEVFLTNAKRQRRFYDTMKTLFTGPRGEEFGLIGVNRDITELVQAKLEAEIARDEAQHMASTDFLTGVLTRRALIQRLEGEINRTRRHTNSVLSMIFTDIDYFKKVNDTYGHQAGDRVLQVVTQLLQSRLRSYDTIGRSGGEEFMIILPDTPREGAFKVAEELRLILSTTPIELFTNKNQKTVVQVTASFGVATMLDSECKEIDDLIREGDHALYKAKEKGRNRVE